MRKRQAEAAELYEKQWDNGKGAHHPDYDPEAVGENVVKGSRATEELYNCIVKNDIKGVYAKIEEKADVNFVFGRAYRSEGGYAVDGGGAQGSSGVCQGVASCGCGSELHERGE